MASKLNFVPWAILSSKNKNIHNKRNVRLKPHRVKHDSQNVADELTFRWFELITNNIGPNLLAEII
jgi:hypothetical protein